ncbi:MAG: DUF3306 domain-containing protein [Rhodobacterales bacterium]|nr:DUF3306 domain-containing protein [Rhodobacterales bacterium]
MSQRTDMWSARKAAVKAEAKAETEAFEAAIVARERDALAEKPDAEILQELALKNPDDMVAGDDFAAFMKAAVPEHLRKRALRKLWLSDPALANLDNLLDYGEDFAAEAKLGAVVETAYQVGKGILGNIDEVAEQAAAPEQAEQSAADAGETPIAVPIAVTSTENSPESKTVQIKDAVHEGDTIAPDVLTEDIPVIAVKRRMRFEFATDDARHVGQGIG